MNSPTVQKEGNVTSTRSGFVEDALLKSTDFACVRKSIWVFCAQQETDTQNTEKIKNFIFLEKNLMDSPRAKS
jgi:hypothetical protein